MQRPRLIRKRRVAAILAAAALTAACGGSQETVATPVSTQAPTPTPPTPSPPPQPEPEPVELQAVFELSDDEVVLRGKTNLPDGAQLYFEIEHYGTGCVTEDCREVRDWSDDQYQMFLAGLSGAVAVSAGAFRTEFPGWQTLFGLCNRNWDGSDPYETVIKVIFMPSQEQASAGSRFPTQPDSIYELYGLEGERLEAVAPAKVDESFRRVVRVEAECIAG